VNLQTTLQAAANALVSRRCSACGDTHIRILVVLAALPHVLNRIGPFWCLLGRLGCGIRVTAPCEHLKKSVRAVSHYRTRLLLSVDFKDALYCRLVTYCCRVWRDYWRSFVAGTWDSQPCDFFAIWPWLGGTFFAEDWGCLV